jgi:ribosomal protein S18 acetylase RimI-like enzyme
MEITIRQLAPGAAPPMELLLDADPSEETVNEYLAAGTCFLAVAGDRIVGVLVITPTRPRMMEIMNVAVHPELQNRGIAKQLIRHAIGFAKASGCRMLEIGTGNPGVIQLLLYQKCGFRITGIDFDFFRRHLPERIYENGIECRDMIRLSLDLAELPPG